MAVAMTDAPQPQADVPPHPATLSRLAFALALLAIIQLLHRVPIAGIAQLLPDGRGAHNASFSIAAIAFQAWLPAAAFAQLAVMALPSRWTRFARRGRHADPFSVPVLLLTALLAYVQATGVAIAFEAMVRPPDTEGFDGPVIASLMAGTALVIACGWLIERFGTGLGFWLALAAQSVMVLVEAVSQGITMAWPVSFGLGALAISAVIYAVMAVLAIGLTLRASPSGSGIEVVAWPLLLTSMASSTLMAPLFDLLGLGSMSMRMGLLVVLLLNLPILAAVTFVITRRDGQPHLFVPVLAVLALIEIAAMLMLMLRFGVSLPLPAGIFVAVLAVLTVLVQRARMH
jgi:hypothetical protein